MQPTDPHRRQCLHLLGGAAAWAGGMQRASASAPAVGQLAPWPQGKAVPAFTALALDGTTRTLADYAGKPLILNFWATYCAPCRLEIPQFNQLLAQHRAQGLRVLAVNHGEMPARVLQFLQTVPFDGDVLLDRSQRQLPAWGGMALPTSFVIDAQGRVRFWHMGEIDWLSAGVQATLAPVFKSGFGKSPLGLARGTNA